MFFTTPGSGELCTAAGVFPAFPAANNNSLSELIICDMMLDTTPATFRKKRKRNKPNLKEHLKMSKKDIF